MQLEPSSLGNRRRCFDPISTEIGLKPPSVVALFTSIALKRDFARYRMSICSYRNYINLYIDAI